MTSLEQIADEALQNGWVSLRTDIRTLLQDAKGLGWRPVPIRRGGPTVSTLRVVDAVDAHPRSLSTTVGAGQQPLHTDGAHQRVMPDLVLLAAAEPSSTPTLLSDPGEPTEAQRVGVFKVGGGRSGFYSGAVDDRDRWRYDPGCMTPMDDHARNAAAELAAMVDSAVVHHWNEPNSVLVIANRRVLHARASAADDSTRRMYRAALVTGLDS
jgi:hypothetical protein